METIVQINGHQYRPLAEVAHAAGLQGGFAKVDAERAGLPVISVSSGGRPRHYVEASDATRFIELVQAQRADGRSRNFGFNAPAPGKSSAANGVSSGARDSADRREERLALRIIERLREVEPIGGGGTGAPNALTVAQVAALQSQLARVERKLDTICRELNITV